MDVQYKSDDGSIFGLHFAVDLGGSFDWMQVFAIALGRGGS